MEVVNFVLESNFVDKVHSLHNYSLSCLKITFFEGKFTWTSSSVLYSIKRLGQAFITTDCQGPVVRKVDRAIRRIAIFLNSLKLFIYWYKPD